jgi:glycosyltransferase involved in cell wall biosynthesis
MKKIKLLHMTSSLKIGGAEAVLCDLIANLDADQFEHAVIYFHDGPHIKCLKNLGISTHQIKGCVSLYDPIFLFRLYSLVLHIKPDVIHTLLWAANVAGRIVGNQLNIPVISAHHNNVDQDGLVRSMLDRITAHMASKLIAVSPEVKQSLLTRDPALSQDKIQIITNGIDFHKLLQNNKLEEVTRKNFGLTDQHFIIGSVGRFVEVKNYTLMIEAFALLHAQYSQARLILIGIGTEEQMLRAKAKTLGISDFVIFIIGQPAYRYYSMFDCFSLTSDKEGISIALLEAMSFGLPCIITNIEKNHAVIKNEINGFLIEARNIQSLVLACTKLIESKQLGQNIGFCAKQTVEAEFNLTSMHMAYATIFKEVIM